MPLQRNRRVQSAYISSTIMMASRFRPSRLSFGSTLAACTTYHGAGVAMLGASDVPVDGAAISSIGSAPGPASISKTMSTIMGAGWSVIVVHAAATEATGPLEPRALDGV